MKNIHLFFIILKKKKKQDSDSNIVHQRNNYIIFRLKCDNFLKSLFYIQGSYIHIPHDHIAYRYEILKVIGKGSFGQVLKVYDHKTHQHVALKMVRNEKRFHRQAQEEIRILEHLRKQDKDNSCNIIHMLDNFTFRLVIQINNLVLIHFIYCSRSHTCITFELLSINLYELIKKNKFQGFSLQLVRKFAHSLLQCLDTLYRNKIIHCDMKPENVLLKQQGRSGIKVGNQTVWFITLLHLLLQKVCKGWPHKVAGNKSSINYQWLLLACKILKHSLKLFLMTELLISTCHRQLLLHISLIKSKYSISGWSQKY